MKAISKKSALNRMDWFDFLNYFIMLLVIVCTVFPLYYCAIVSISNGAAVTKGEVVFAPVGFDTTAYKVVFGNSQILRSYGNTIYYTLLGTAINIALTVLCAYPLSRPTLKSFELFVHVDNVHQWRHDTHVSASKVAWHAGYRLVHRFARCYQHIQHDYHAILFQLYSGGNA